MIFQSLYSGSSGNCLLVKHKNTVLLIDAGVTGRKISSALTDYDNNPDVVDALLITHEHDDHISGAGVYCRKTGLKIYANEKTHEAMRPKLGKISDNKLEAFETGKSFVIKDLEIQPFATSHDAAESVGFRIYDGKTSVGIATDLGVASESVIKELCKCDTVLIEANHDLDMLMSGPYPHYLKQRIMSNDGHLSNLDSGGCCCRLVKSGVETIILGHLSEQNNKPLLALNSVSGVLSDNGIVRNKDYRLIIAMRDRPSDIIS